MLHIARSSDFMQIAGNHRYSPACTRLLSQYKTMLRLVGDDVKSIEEFMARYRVSLPSTLYEYYL